MKIRALIIMVLLATLLAFYGGTAESPLDTDHGEVVSMTVKQDPDKMEYVAGEAFTAEGGLLAIEFADGTVVDVSMTDSHLEVNEPNTSRAGSKNVAIKYGGKKVSFKITVLAAQFTVTFDLGDGRLEEQSLEKGKQAEQPEDPERVGFLFGGWYEDAECTIGFDFKAPLSDSLTVYAFWMENGAAYHTVTFSTNYYGSSEILTEELVKSGDSFRLPAVLPERQGYSFSGWFMDPDGSTPLDPNMTANGDLIIYAGWDRTQSGSSIYIFEAEDVNLTGKSGPGYSGENAGIGMVVLNPEPQPSQDRFVAYQCRNGNSLEFYLASDTEADAMLTVRFAAEYSDMILTPSMYEITINEEPIAYSALVLQLVPGSQQGVFQDYMIGTIHLNQGANLIRLKTINSEPLGGTLTATAPIIDCIKIETSAVVIWDENYGVPALGNYKK